MLYGDLDSYERFALPDSLVCALKFLRDNERTAVDGRVNFEDGMYAELKRYAPLPRHERSYESHVKFADVQCVLDGEEIIYVRPLSNLLISEDHLSENDIAFYAEPNGNETEFPILMRPGKFLLLLPDDAHKTECLTTVKACRKVIFKIPVTALQ